MVINLSLVELDDSGVLANIDCHHALITEETTLCCHEAELAKVWFDWCNKVGPIRQQLAAAQAHTCLHPYITNKIPLHPNKHCPEEITVAEALLMNNHILHFHILMPWSAGEEHPKVT